MAHVVHTSIVTVLPPPKTEDWAYEYFQASGDSALLGSLLIDPGYERGHRNAASVCANAARESNAVVLASPGLLHEPSEQGKKRHILDRKTRNVNGEVGIDNPRRAAELVSDNSNARVRLVLGYCNRVLGNFPFQIRKFETGDGGTILDAVLCRLKSLELSSLVEPLTKKSILELKLDSCS